MMITIEIYRDALAQIAASKITKLSKFIAFLEDENNVKTALRWIEQVVGDKCDSILETACELVTKKHNANQNGSSKVNKYTLQGE